MEINENNIGAAYNRMTRYYPDEETESKEPSQIGLPVLETIPIEWSEPGAMLSMPLGKILAERRSKRAYRDGLLSKQAFFELIWSAQGVIQTHGPYFLRTTPSAGALHPLTLYISCRSVESMKPGLYRLTRDSSKLELLRNTDISEELCGACLGQRMVASAQVCFIWSSVAARCTNKYAERGYRYMYMDAAHSCHNVWLAATALSLGCCSIGAFFDPLVDSIIGANGQEEFSVYLATVGLLKDA